MKSLYLNQAISTQNIVLTSEKTFVIGVKNKGCSLEVFQEIYPEVKIERLPEVVNPRYMNSSPEEHILQPAFIWKEDSSEIK